MKTWFLAFLQMLHSIMTFALSLSLGRNRENRLSPNSRYCSNSVLGKQNLGQTLTKHKILENKERPDGRKFIPGTNYGIDTVWIIMAWISCIAVQSAPNREAESLRFLYVPFTLHSSRSGSHGTSCPGDGNPVVSMLLYGYDFETFWSDIPLTRYLKPEGSEFLIFTSDIVNKAVFLNGACHLANYFFLLCRNQVCLWKIKLRHYAQQ